MLRYTQDCQKKIGISGLDNSESIANQLALLKEYARRERLRVVGEYIDLYAAFIGTVFVNKLALRQLNPKLTAPMTTGLTT